jgi:hypothetical protein
MTRFWNNLQQVRSIYRYIGTPNNLKVCGSNNTKGPKRDSQNRLRSPMPDGGEP